MRGHRRCGDKSPTVGHRAAQDRPSSGVVCTALVLALLAGALQLPLTTVNAAAPGPPAHRVAQAPSPHASVPIDSIPAAPPSAATPGAQRGPAPVATPAPPLTSDPVPVPAGFTLPLPPSGFAPRLPTPAAVPPAGSEILSARTRDSATFQNPDGSRTAVLRPNMHYESSPGHLDPVDLTFRPRPGGFSADHSSIPVTASALGVEASDPASGQGLRWLTPGMAVVSGTVATAPVGGASWSFVPTGSGLSVSAIIPAAVGEHTYAFPYVLLGGATPLAVDPRGSLMSSSFSVSRAVVIGSDGSLHQAGPWGLLPGDVAVFSFDDAVLGPRATPYVVDPVTNFSRFTNGGASFIATGAGYPPAAGATTLTGNNFLLIADDNNGGGQFSVSDAVLTYDTSPIPATAVATAASMAANVCLVTQADPAERLYGDWVSGQALDPHLYPTVTATGSALNGETLPPTSSDAPNPSACVNGTGASGSPAYPIGTGATPLNPGPLNTGSGFSPGGTTALRLWFSNRTAWPSSPAPAASTYLYLAGTTNPSTGGPPFLLVTYFVPVSPPSLVTPAAGSSVHTLTPPVQVSTTDPDGDNPVTHYLYSIVDSANHTVWSSGLVNSAAPQTPPAGALGWNQTYTLVGCGWDGVDTFANYPAGGIVCNAWLFDTNNPPPPAPTVTTTTQPANPWKTTRTINLTWADSDPTGITGYSYTGFDRQPVASPPQTSLGPGTSVTLTAPADGVWYFHVRAQNATGAWGPQTDFQVDIAANVPINCTAQPFTAVCTPSSTAAGLEAFYPYAPFNLGNGTAYTNMATGNLVAQYTDVNVPGQGLTMRLTRTYNAALDTPTATAGALGKGWTLGVESGSDGSATNGSATSGGLGSLLGLNLNVTPTVAADQFIFTDNDGTAHSFAKNSMTGAWVSPPGVNLVLTQTSAPLAPSYTLTRPDGISYLFQIVGTTNFALTRISNRNNTAFLCFNYAPVLLAPACTSGTPIGSLLAAILNAGSSLANPRLLSVTDENQRGMNLTWNADTLQEVDFQPSLLAPVLRTTYSVTGGRLVSATQAAGTSQPRTTNYAYAPTGGPFGLTSVTNQYVSPGGSTSNQTTAFQYSTTQTVTQTSSPVITRITDRANQPWTFTYGGPSCTPAVPGAQAICLTDPLVAATVWTSDPATLNLLARRDAGDVDIANHPRFNLASYGWQNNRLVTATDEAGSQSSYAYNPLGQITQTVFAGSGVGDLPLTTRLFYQPSPVTPSVSDLSEEDVGFATPQVRKSLFSTDSATGLLTQTVQPGNNSGSSTTTATYYPNNLLKSLTDADNNTTQYGYPVTGTAANNYGYDVSGQPLAIIDALGHGLALAYDYLGNPITRLDRAGQLWTSAYDPFGNVVETIAPAGETTFSCFDTNGNQAVAIKAGSPANAGNACSQQGTDGFSTRTAYDPRDLVSSSTTRVDGQMSKTSFTYLANGLLQHVIEPRSYDAAGNLLTDPTGIAQVTATYYPDTRMATATNEVGAVASATYTPTGWPAVVTAPAHDVTGTARTSTTTTYTGRGQVRTSQATGVAGPTVNTYDLFGEVTATTTPNASTTNVSYWPSGLRQTTTMPATLSAPATVATSNYDPAGNITSLVQPTGAGGHTTVTYTYTRLNQIQSETDPADVAHTVSYAYDNEARQVARGDLYNGVTETTRSTGFDKDGRPVTATASSTTGAPPFSTTTGYDSAGRPSTMASALAGNPVSSITTTYTPEGLAKTLAETLSVTGTSVTKITNDAYLSDGRLAARGFDGVTTTYGYDLAGQEVTTAPWTGGTFTSSYLPSGDLLTQTLPNGAVTTHSFDAADRLSSRSVSTSGGTTLSTWAAIQYDNDGNRLTQAVSQQTANPLNPAYTGPSSWSYDSQDRMTSYQGPLDAVRTNYALDDAGNVTNDGTTAFSYNANRLTSSVAAGTTTTYAYDHVGNQTSAAAPSGTTTNSYDAAFHPLTVSPPGAVVPVTFGYDALGRLAVRQDTLGVTAFFFHAAGADQVEQEYDLGALPATITYLLDSAGHPLGQVTGAPLATPTYNISDPRSDVVQVLDAGAAVMNTYGYDPFGNPKALQTTPQLLPPPGSRLQFQGSPKDATISQYTLGPRLYNPQIDRFVGADLYAGASSGLATQMDPLTGNRYLYAGANPAGLIDNGYGWLPCLHHTGGGCVGGGVVKNPYVIGAGAGILTGVIVVAVATACVGSVGFGCPEAILAGTTGESVVVGEADALVNLDQAAGPSGDSAGSAAEDATSRTALARRLGAEGERAANIDQGAKVRIPSATGTAQFRVPDAITKTSLIEVKNVAYLGYNSQLQDFYEYAVAKGLKLEIIVRSGAGTRLSGSLQQLVDQKQITINPILP